MRHTLSQTCTFSHGIPQPSTHTPRVEDDCKHNHNHLPTLADLPSHPNSASTPGTSPTPTQKQHTWWATHVHPQALTCVGILDLQGPLVAAAASVNVDFAHENNCDLCGDFDFNLAHHTVSVENYHPHDDSGRRVFVVSVDDNHDLNQHDWTDHNLDINNTRSAISLTTIMLHLVVLLARSFNSLWSAIHPTLYRRVLTKYKYVVTVLTLIVVLAQCWQRCVSLCHYHQRCN